MLNRTYSGEYTVKADYTQADLEELLKAGYFAFHTVGGEVRVLGDINSLTTLTDDKGKVFTDNQTIRIIDQIANDIANIFNDKYLGKVPNDQAGRISLWSDIVRHHEELQALRAIEDFKDEHVIVEPGSDKKTVVIQDKITVVNTMAQLYMTVVVA